MRTISRGRTALMSLKLAGLLAICLTQRAVAQAGQFAQTGPTSEGLTAVAQYFQDPQFQRMQNLKWGFVDGSGNFITSPPFQFDQVQPFSGGFAGVAIYVQDPNVARSKNLKWGFINRAGKLITGHPGPPSFPFDGVRRFSEGFAAVMNRYADNPVVSPNAVTEHWCFINSQGASINPSACFPEVGDFSGGRARVRSGTQWGCIDPSGRFSLKCSNQTAGGKGSGTAPKTAAATAPEGRSVARVSRSSAVPAPYPYPLVLGAWQGMWCGVNVEDLQLTAVGGVLQGTLTFRTFHSEREVSDCAGLQPRLEGSRPGESPQQFTIALTNPTFDGQTLSFATVAAVCNKGCNLVFSGDHMSGGGELVLTPGSPPIVFRKPQ